MTNGETIRTPSFKGQLRYKTIHWHKVALDV